MPTDKISSAAQDVRGVAPVASMALLALSHAGFMLIGIINTMLGPLLPFLSTRWHLNDTQAGIVLLVQPAGATLGSLLSGILIKRYGFARPLTFGFILMSLSTACLCFESWRIGMIAITGSGLSLGLTIPTINLLISEANAGRRAAALNVLNLVWGLGAVTGPLLISTLARISNFRGALFFLAGSAAMLAALMASLPLRSQFLRETRVSDPGSASVRQGVVPYLLLFGALVFINVGTESATGGWIATYVKRLGNAPNLSWALASSLFWAGLLAGRAVAPLVLRYLKETKIVLAGMLLAVCGLLVILLNAETGIVLMGVALTGLGLAPVFPTTLALFTQRFGAESPQLTGILFILAGLGSAFFPGLVGLLSSRFNGLRAGLFVPLVGAIMMIALQLAITAMMRSKERLVE